MKRKGLTLCAGIFLWVTSSSAEVINRIVATVDDEPITLYEVRNFGKGPDGQRNLLMPEGGAAGMSDRDILEALIMTKLVGKEVEAQGVTAKEEDIDSYIERIKNQNSLDDEQFKAALANQGLTMESYRKQIADEIGRALLINREIGARVNVTAQDVERYYKEHGGEYLSAEQIRVRHLFLPLSPTAPTDEEQEVLNQIKDIYNRAVAGENFATLADTYSRGPGAGQGGDLGFFKKGQMAKEIEEVAFALKPGEISQPFRTNAGVHLLKVEEHVAAGQQQLDPTTAEEIKRKLYNEALRQRYERWFQEDLRFRHNVENFLTASSGIRPPPVGMRKSETAVGTIEEKEAPSATAAEPEREKGFFRRLWPF